MKLCSPKLAGTQMLVIIYTLDIADHNYHIHRAVKTRSDGTPLTFQENKRHSANWTLRNCKEKKKYGYNSAIVTN